MTSWNASTKLSYHLPELFVRVLPTNNMKGAKLNSNFTIDGKTNTILHENNRITENCQVPKSCEMKEKIIQFCGGPGFWLIDFVTQISWKVSGLPNGILTRYQFWRETLLIVLMWFNEAIWLYSHLIRLFSHQSRLVSPRR